jgi:hypothetical protein
MANTKTIKINYRGFTIYNCQWLDNDYNFHCDYSVIIDDKFLSDQDIQPIQHDIDLWFIDQIDKSSLS